MEGDVSEELVDVTCDSCSKALKAPKSLDDEVRKRKHEIEKVMHRLDEDIENYDGNVEEVMRKGSEDARLSAEYLRLYHVPDSVAGQCIFERAEGQDKPVPFGAFPDYLCSSCMAFYEQCEKYHVITI